MTPDELDLNLVRASAVGPVPPPRALMGDEPFIGIPARVLDFWRFGMSDLRANTLRGLVAEFLVAQAVGSSLRRVEWAAYDVKTPDGITVEVKCSAYLQTWSQPQLSRIEFTRLRSRLDPATNNGDAGTPDYHAAVYVFAVQAAQSHDVFNVLDLGQWIFYVAPRAAVAATGQDSLGLNRVARIASPGVGYDRFNEAISRAGAQAADQDLVAFDLVRTESVSPHICTP